MKNKTSYILYLVKTYLRFFKVKKIKAVVFGDYIIRAANLGDWDQINHLRLATNHKELTGRNKRLITFINEKLSFVCIHNEKVVGFNFYYLNQRDLKESTIHEGFIGVLPEYQGKGIATEIRKNAIKHFESNGFVGISSRISLSNKASLNSALKLGYKPVETYFDKEMNEERHYLICNFKDIISE